jgi:hypothetical protein
MRIFAGWCSGSNVRTGLAAGSHANVRTERHRQTPDSSAVSDLTFAIKIRSDHRGECLIHRTRQFLPGGLLINGTEILVVVGGRDDNQRHKIEHKINQGKPPCVTMISAAAMTSKTVATTAAAA